MPYAIVFAKDIQAAYLAPYETGGVQYLGRKRALLNSKDIRLNQYRNLPKDTLARLKGHKDVIIGSVKTKGGAISGAWQRMTPTKRGRNQAAATGPLKLLIRWGDPQPVQPKPHFGDRARQVVGANLQTEFVRRWLRHSLPPVSGGNAGKCSGPVAAHRRLGAIVPRSRRLWDMPLPGQHPGLLPPSEILMFRELYNQILSCRSYSLYWHTLVPWLESHQQELDWLRLVAARTESDILPKGDDALYYLYALSRVNDTLLVRFQTGTPIDTHWPGFNISIDEYTNFMTGLGFRVVAEPAFSPFFHEIVEVEQSSDDDAPITLGGEYWPTLMLGRMLFSRGGAYVSGGRNHIRRNIAESSTMYWAYRRRCRRALDLSHGWGSQSQWGTDIRADYQIGGTLIYNADGEYNLAASAFDAGITDLSRDELIELVTHRCFVTVEKPHHDLFPYRHSYTAPSQGAPDGS